jgi:CHASE3 domain sensor protein
MNDDPNEDPTRSSDPWEEVGRQFKALGESVASAVRAAMQDEQHREHFDKMRAGVEAMAEEVNRTFSSPEAQELRQEAELIARSAAKGAKSAAEEARPHVASALRQVSTELQKLIEQLEKEDRP